MQVYGSSDNLSSFNRYGLKILEAAGMDYNKALSGAEIYLGEIFSDRVVERDAMQIFDPGIDRCRAHFGEKAVKARLNAYLGYELGRLVQKLYLPATSLKWREMEGMLGHKLDFTEYYSRLDQKKYCPAWELAANLFDCAIKGRQELAFNRIVAAGACRNSGLGEEVLVPRDLKKVRIRINPHLWRKWFYSLWGQGYEWGYFVIGEKLAMADEHIYFFETPPQIINKRSFVPARDFLEAHGFKLSYGKDGRIEYWR